MTTLERSSGRLAFRLATPSLSGLIRVRMLGVCLGLAAVAFVLFCVEVAVGDYPLSLPEVVSGLWGTCERGTLLVIHELRLPRALLALLAGAAFAMSGSVFQTITRNPLASPDMIGISAGATTAVVMGIVLGFGSGLGTQTLGLTGGLVSALLIYLLAWRRGATGYRIVLVGIGVSWVCSGITDYLFTKAFPWQANLAVGWMVGNLNERTWDQVYPLAVTMAVLVPVGLLLGPWMRHLQLGDTVAVTLGVPVGIARLALMFVGVGLVAFATAATGPILFVALAAPQIAQRLAGVAWPPMLASGLTGAVMVLGADLLSRKVLPVTSLADNPIPVGVVTAVLAAPVLLWLLARANRIGTGGLHD